MDIVAQFGIIFLASVIFILLALRLKLPPVVGLLLAGMIIGPNLLGLVQQNEYISIFSDIGAMLLLFSVGLEFSLHKIANVWLRSLIIWFVKDALVFIVVYEASLLLGLDETVSLVLGSALAVSSTTFFIKLVNERNLGKTPEVNTMLMVLILEDLLAVFVLAIYSGMGAGQEFSTTLVLMSILRAIIALTVAYIILQKAVHVIFEKLADVKSDEVMVFLSMSFAILLSFFASAIGLTPSIGAFLAGSILASIKGFKKTEDTLSKFNMLFSAFFFLSIGMLVDFNSMLQNLPVIAVLFVVLSCGVFGSIFVPSYLLGYRSEQSVRSGMLMLAAGEFSLIIAKEASGLVAPFDIISIIAALVFLTALNGGIAAQYEKEFAKRFKFLVPQRVRDSAKRVSLYLNEVMKEFEAHGSVYDAFTKESKNVVLNVVFLALISITGALGYLAAPQIFQTYETHIYGAGFLFSLIPIVSLVNSIRKMINSVAHAFHKSLGENLAMDDIAMRDSAIAFLMLAIAVMTPPVVSLLKLPSMFGMLFIIPLALCALFVWNLSAIVRKIMTSRAAYHYEKAKEKFVGRYGPMLGEVSSINKPGYRGRNK